MKRDIYTWISDYGVSHQNPTNKKIHWVCVPAIMFTLLGLLSLVKFNIEDFNINLAYILVTLAWLFYLNLSIKISVGMLLISAFSLWAIYQLEQSIGLENQSLLFIYVGVFVLAWIGQFIGHKIEGQKPSFFEDLQFLLIGPAWLLSFIYEKLGIKY
tara:strand:- start:1171 stop:1641 length:471 start_codon:yes stop_codon:yes gene_type:complete